MRFTITRVAMTLLVMGGLPGCRRDAADDQQTGTITPEAVAQARADWPAGVEAQIDSGNTAYSAQNFERASLHYRRAAELGPEVSAAWFGIYMAEHARGNIAAADSAMERTRRLAPGASLLHAPPADSGRRRP
jgi:Flp pilus assembly protein TadD